MDVLSLNTYRFTVRGVLPTRQAYEWNFRVSFSECGDMVIKKPKLISQVYYVTQALSEYLIADWRIVPTSCAAEKRDYFN